MNILQDFKLHRRIVLGTLFLGLVDFTFLSCLIHLMSWIYGFSFDGGSAINIYFIFVNCFRAYHVIQFYLVCSAVRLRFRTINQKFKFSTSSSMKLTLINCFHGLSDAIDIINKVFTFHFFMLFTHILVILKID